MTSSQQIKFGAILSYLSLGINVLSGLIYTPWVINTIGRENYGLYTLALSVITLFVFDFGLSNAVTRFVAKYLAEKRQDLANKCIGSVYKLYLYIDVLLFVFLLGVYFFIPDIYEELTNDEIEKFKVVYIIASVFSILSFPFIPVNGILNANEKYIQIKICDLFHKVLIVALMTLCLLQGLGLYALVTVNAGVGIVIILFKIFCIKRYTNTRIDFKENNKKQLKEVLKFSVWTTIIAICTRMMFTIAPTILGIYSGSISIAIFGIANTIEGYVYTFSNALSGMFLPKVSRIVLSGDGNVLPLMVKVGRLQLLICGLIVGGFICCGSDFIILWVGNGFSDSYLCSVLLILPAIFQLPQEIGMQLIYVKNQVKAQAIIWIIMAFINIVLSFILTYNYGALGICFSICIAYLVRTFCLDILFKRILKLNISLFFKEVFLSIGPMIVLVTFLFVIINSYLSNLTISNIELLLLKAFVFCVLYALGTYLVSNSNERKMIKSILKK